MDKEAYNKPKEAGTRAIPTPSEKGTASYRPPAYDKRAYNVPAKPKQG